MCGIAGFIEAPGAMSPARMEAVAGAMADSLAHRGPDDRGVWADAAAGVAFGHRRLAVVDLSAAGHQPMVSACGRFVIAYNGEIYNSAEIRAELERAGHRPPWRGHSDTETILEACVRWGVAAAVPRLIGMFAFALWDREAQTLSLVRDRLGIKPLYWAEFGSVFAFASELKALKRHPSWRGGIDRDALTAYLRYSYVPAPFSIHPGVRKLEPGHILRFGAGRAPESTAYWNLEQVAREGLGARLGVSADEATDRLEALLMDAVGRRMVADVRVGAFLSGGIDSSTVVAMMKAQGAGPVSTFSIGFAESDYDEAAQARAVAAHLGTDHTELYVEPRDALDLIPRLPFIFDEPFADSSQIPTCLVSEMTRRHVTVALSGDGGDEVFAGYNRHLLAAGFWQQTRRMPQALRGLTAALMRALPAHMWTRLAQLVPERRRPRQTGEKLHKLADVLDVDAAEVYSRLVSHWQDPAGAMVEGVEPPNLGTDPAAASFLPTLLERMQYLDARTYLPDDILAKVDRASMAFSLEARVPLLDHRVVEFAWSLPVDMRVRKGETKWLLRRVLDRHVPNELVARPKSGFAVPIDSWLRGPLREWAEALLAEGRLRREGYFRPGPVRERWHAHLSGRRNCHDSLWSVLMFQAWLEAEDGAARAAA